MLGHFLKVVAFYFIYRALIYSALEHPEESIFFSLNQERQRLQERFSAIMDLSPDIISIIDSKGILRYNSPACEKIHGRLPKEMVGKDTSHWIHPDDLPLVQAAMGNLFNKKSEIEAVSYRYLHKNGEYTWMEATAVNQLDNKNIQGLIVISRDITERKNQEEKLKRAQTQAIAANQAKSIFLANMSHEIRTPLNAIIGMSDILGETELKIDQRGYLNTIQKAGNSLLDIINNILDLSQIESGIQKIKEEKFLLKELIESTIQLVLKPIETKKLKLELNYPQELTQTFFGNTFFIKRILINLLSNAIKFSEQGTISLEVEILEKTLIHSTLLFRIKDQGIGIHPELTKDLFCRFRQLDDSPTKKYGGSGLGLSLCKEMVEQMGGTIEFSPNSPVGSCFSFSLKLSHAQNSISHAETYTDQENTFSLLSQPLEIMLADDSEENRELIELFLRKFPFKITFAKDGLVAFEIFQRQKFDIVFMDIQMPIMDGITATQKIREWENLQNRCPTTIVALSAYAMQEDCEKALAAGCDFHLAKPIRKATLLRLIHEIVSSEAK